MNPICRFTVPASRDVESIIDYVADNRSLDAAERLLNQINQKCKILKLSFSNRKILVVKAGTQAGVPLIDVSLTSGQIYFNFISFGVLYSQQMML